MKRFKQYLLGQYPYCDYLDQILRFLCKDFENNKTMIEDLTYIIRRANGYFYEDNKQALREHEVV